MRRRRGEGRTVQHGQIGGSQDVNEGNGGNGENGGQAGLDEYHANMGLAYHVLA